MGRSQKTNAKTSILVNRTIAPQVNANDILLEGRAQYITIQLPSNGSLIIVNIYENRSSKERAPMWRKLSETAFIANHIIIGGDFNHLEETNYRGLVEERQMHKREVATWHHMML
jgi:endonuclease/exonuclease/phosphatase family metal-dependent hydrolase